MNKMEIKKEYYELLRIDDKTYNVRVIFKKIKNLYVKISDKGDINLVVPYRMSEKDANKFLLSKKEWIKKSIDKVQKRNRIKDEIKKDKRYEDKEFNDIVFSLIDEQSKLMNLYPNKVTIKKLKYAWGSCSAKKNISINSELIYYDKEIIRYVIIHELSHLKYMNHSNKFWNLVNLYDNDYKEHRKKLKM